MSTLLEIIVWTPNFQIPVILSRLFFANLKCFKPVLCARFRVVSVPNQKNSSNTTKAELPQEGIFFALNFFPWEFLLIKKLEIEKTKAT